MKIPRGGEAVECFDCHGGEAWGRACETCTGHGYVITENQMEREWNEISQAASEIADALMSLDTQLGIAADSLQVLIAKASDTRCDLDSPGLYDEDLKRDVIGVWRATLENVLAAQAALVSRK